jgi:hypothetical protein
MVHVNTQKSQGKIKKITALLDSHNGEILKKNPKCINSYECAGF